MSSSDAPTIVVGLGNPGPKYAKNRHNVGFMAVDRWAQDNETSPAWRERFSALVAPIVQGESPGIRCLAVKPQDFMNRSGEAVAQAARFHKTQPEKIVVVHDELDFDFGRVQIKFGGGHGGHNGLRDIHQKLGSANYVRVRVGIGRPTRGEVSAWVLSDFSTSDLVELPEVLDRANLAIRAVVDHGPERAMNLFNSTTN